MRSGRRGVAAGASHSLARPGAKWGCEWGCGDSGRADRAKSRTPKILGVPKSRCLRAGVRASASTADRRERRRCTRRFATRPARQSMLQHPLSRTSQVGTRVRTAARANRSAVFSRWTRRNSTRRVLFVSHSRRRRGRLQRTPPNESGLRNPYLKSLLRRRSGRGERLRQGRRRRARAKRCR